MKTPAKLIAFFVLFGTIFFTACTDPTDDGSYVDPVTLYEKIEGEWTLADIRQIDETAKAAGISPDEISLFSRFNFGSFKIALNVGADKKSTSYEVKGTAPDLFPKNGFWELDSEFPSASGMAPIINLFSDAAKTQAIGRLALTAVPGAKKEMELKLTRTTKGVPFVSYLYKLNQ
jgi:hypothetical protein